MERLDLKMFLNDLWEGGHRNSPDTPLLERGDGRFSHLPCMLLCMEFHSMRGEDTGIIPYMEDYYKGKYTEISKRYEFCLKIIVVSLRNCQAMKKSNTFLSKRGAN